MKSLEIICCLFIVIFALAVAHPLPDNVLELEEAKEAPPRPALNNPTGPAPGLKDSPRPALLFENPTASALPLKDPSSPALFLKDPTEPPLALNDPSSPALLLKDPTASADLLKFSADDNAPSFDMSQDDSQEQQDTEAIMLSDEALEAIFNDIPQENELQKEE